MFYVYPLKFMFDSGFAQFLPGASQGAVPMTLAQLAHASAIYGLGFVALFVMFALLYLHAYRKRHDLGLKPLEVFDVRSFAGQQIVSAAVGVIVVLIAVAGPRRYAFISPMAFILMWPAHGLYETRTKKKRKAFEASCHRNQHPRPLYLRREFRDYLSRSALHRIFGARASRAARTNHTHGPVPEESAWRLGMA